MVFKGQRDLKSKRSGEKGSNEDSGTCKQAHDPDPTFSPSGQSVHVSCE